MNDHRTEFTVQMLAFWYCDKINTKDRDTRATHSRAFLDLSSIYAICVCVCRSYRRF